MSRDLNQMHPRLRAKYDQFAQQMQRAALPYVVTCVDRTIVEQMALYVQGRLELADVNRFRVVADMLPLTTAENKRRVTWTLASLHVTNGFDRSPENDLARAFDIAIVKDGRAVWDLKASVNGNEVPDYEEAGRIWESLGGTWGGRFSTPDCPHFQL